MDDVLNKKLDEMEAGIQADASKDIGTVKGAISKIGAKSIKWATIGVLGARDGLIEIDLSMSYNPAKESRKNLTLAHERAKVKAYEVDVSEAEKYLEEAMTGGNQDDIDSAESSLYRAISGLSTYSELLEVAIAKKFR